MFWLHLTPIASISFVERMMFKNYAYSSNFHTFSTKKNDSNLLDETLKNLAEGLRYFNTIQVSPK